jgi:hypothetical protein
MEGAVDKSQPLNTGSKASAEILIVSNANMLGMRPDFVKCCG